MMLLMFLLGSAVLDSSQS